MSIHKCNTEKKASMRDKKISVLHKVCALLSVSFTMLNNCIQPQN